MKLILLTIIAAILLTSCSEDKSVNTDKEAVKLTLENVKTYPGFIEFESTYSLYDLDNNYIDSINSVITAEDKVYIYLKPDCSCTASYKTFPSLIKTIDSSGISYDNVNIYMMESEQNPYPESDFIEINDLPRFYIMSGGLVTDITETSDTITIEKNIYNAIKK